LLVIAAMAVMARLGIWQLDRLEQRKAFNASVLAQVNQPSILLRGATLNTDLSGMEYRPVIVEGVYDHSQEVALRNQAWNDQIGVHLLTPLKIAGSDQAVLVDRGWVPVQDFSNHDWSQYTEPGAVRVQGVIRLPSEAPDFGRRLDPPGRLEIWNFTNVARIDEQITYPLLSIYIQQAPDASWNGLPYRTQPELDLTEGPHLGYAFQWFTFAIILGLGYPFFIRKQENARLRKLEQSNAKP
jgi:surfeit locus 1 family protein